MWKSSFRESTEEGDARNFHIWRGRQGSSILQRGIWSRRKEEARAKSEFAEVIYGRQAKFDIVE